MAGRGRGRDSGCDRPPGTNPNGGARGPTGRGFDCRPRRGHRRGCARCRRRSVELSDLDAERRRSRVPGIALGGPGRHRKGRIRLWRIHVARGELGFQRGGSGGANAIRTSDLPSVRRRCTRRGGPRLTLRRRGRHLLGRSVALRGWWGNAKPLGYGDLRLQPLGCLRGDGVGLCQCVRARRRDVRPTD